MTTRIREIGFDQGYALVEPLLALHYDEVAQFKDLHVVKPNLARYRELEAEGRLFSLIALVDDITVGYSCNFLPGNMHYMDARPCENDVLFLHPNYRNAKLGIALINQTVAVARSKGAQLMIFHAKYDTAMDRLLEAMGYEILDIKRAIRL
jgi:GNAT superfamily N-acetyltransferase